jgi:hypothetical protein
MSTRRKAISTAKTKRRPRATTLPMAKRAQVARLNDAIGHGGFAVADLRAGALRLLMLAASFEHRPTGSRDPTAERQIRRVLTIIGPHVKGNAEAEERARVATLSRRVAAFYDLYRRDESFNADAVECAMKNMLKVEGYAVTAEALDELVPAEQEIRAAGGPQEAADLQLAAVLAVAPKSIENWRLGNVPVGTQAPFEVQVGPLNMVLHVVEMLLAVSPGPDFDLDKVKTLLLELIEKKHATVAPGLSRLTAIQGRAVTKLEL